MDVRESQCALAQGIPWSQRLIWKVLRICLCQVPALCKNCDRVLLKWAIVQLSLFESVSGLHTMWFSFAPGHLCGLMWQKVSCRFSCGAGAIGKGAGSVWGQTAPGCSCWQIWCCILHLYCFKRGWECHQRVQPASVQWVPGKLWSRVTSFEIMVWECEPCSDVELQGLQRQSAAVGQFRGGSRRVSCH